MEATLAELALSNPKEAHCYIHMYRSSLPVLIVHIKPAKKEPLLRLSFVTPIYLEGPMEWTGAEFEVGTEEEQSAFWNAIWSSTMPQEVFSRNYRLFKAHIVGSEPPRQVKIIASEVKVLRDSD